MRTCVVFALFVVCAANAVSQQLSSQTRAQAIAEAFSKHKSGVKEKHGVRTTKYKDVRSAPVVKQNIADYSGAYEVSDLGLVINIQVGTDGRVQASGNDNGRAFRLENARIESALLTASKVYQDGTSETFEGAFLNRTARDSASDPGVTVFGLGVFLTAPVKSTGLTYEKIFYQLKK